MQNKKSSRSLLQRQIVTVTAATIFIVFVFCLFLITGFFILRRTQYYIHVPGITDKISSYLEEKVSSEFIEPSPDLSSIKKLPVIKQAPEFQDITKWFNTTKDLQLEDLRGKIVLVTFGRLYCSYCLNVYPFMNSWHRRYSNDVVIIAIQSSKYEQEKDIEAIQKAITERDVTFPVGFDEFKSTSRFYEPDFVPYTVLIDRNGYIRFEHTGEGNFDLIENKIKELLEEK